jgi:Effector-associated domain 7
MVLWPWQKDKVECKYLIRHYGRGGEISGVSIPHVQLGKIAVDPKLLQAASQALELIDASQYYLCQSLNNAPDQETKRKYYDLMMQDRLRAQDIIMGLAAFSINPQSKSVEEGLMKMLLQNHNRALQIDAEKVEVIPEPDDNSADKIEISNTSFKDKIYELEKLRPSYTNALQETKSQANSLGIEPVGILHLLTEKFSLAELKTLCFEFGVDYDDISGDTKKDKARELILYHKRRGKLNHFYEFLTDYIERRS